jgi:hypothetical protein
MGRGAQPGHRLHRRCLHHLLSPAQCRGARACDDGPFLIPVFGILWGALFLHEHVSLAMLEGCAIVLAGTALATGVIKRVPGFSALARKAWRGARFKPR